MPGLILGLGEPLESGDIRKAMMLRLGVLSRLGTKLRLRDFGRWRTSVPFMILLPFWFPWYWILLQGPVNPIVVGWYSNCLFFFFFLNLYNEPMPELYLSLFLWTQGVSPSQKRALAFRCTQRITETAFGTEIM